MMRNGLGLVLPLLLIGCVENAWAQSGDVQDVHDPVMIREGDAFYVFSSGAGVPVRRSTDMVQWERIGRVFGENVPTWAQKEIPGAVHIWAPDISYYNNLFHLYYSVSTPGSQRSCIGLATNETLDPSSPKFKWVDHGKVIESFPDKMDFNAIDPNLVLDKDGNPWLVWGSFWGGVKMVRLDAKTGMPPAKNTRIHNLAARPVRLAIEAPFLVYKNGYYYLFASFEHCCRGIASNYKVMVGRSKEITGPYVDFDGRPMLEGNATLVLAGYDKWRGPGHNGVMLGSRGDWMVHHMYDVDAKGRPTMQIRPLIWTENGWPVVGEPINRAYASRPEIKAESVVGAWRHSVAFGAEDFLELLSEGRMNSAVDRATWSLDGEVLKLRWPDPGAPGGAWVDTCYVAPDGASYVGRNQGGLVIRGRRL